jgi:hypothetical protein
MSNEGNKTENLLGSAATESIEQIMKHVSGIKEVLALSAVQRKSDEGIRTFMSTMITQPEKSGAFYAICAIEDLDTLKTVPRISGMLWIT